MAYISKSGKHRSEHPTVSCVIPCFNEEAVLPALFSRLDSLESDAFEYAFMFVDDGSTDSTREMIREYALSRNRVDYVFLSRNFGKEIAMLAGTDRTESDALVFLDADLQDPPELIEDMVRLWKQGYDDVAAKRRSRAGECWWKRASSAGYYRTLQAFTKVVIQQNVGDFRLVDRKCILALRACRERNRNTKALFSWMGFSKTEILYDRDKRVSGSSKWSVPKLFTLAFDGIMSFSTAPMKIASIAGMSISILTFVYVVFIVLRTIIVGVDVPGYASVLVAVLFLGGLQLCCIGIIGEYLGRVFVEVKQRPEYFIDECKRADGCDNS